MRAIITALLKNLFGFVKPQTFKVLLRASLLSLQNKFLKFEELHVRCSLNIIKLKDNSVYHVLGSFFSGYLENLPLHGTCREKTNL